MVFISSLLSFSDHMHEEIQVSVLLSFLLNEFARLIGIIVEAEPEFRRKLLAAGKKLEIYQHDCKMEMFLMLFISENILVSIVLWVCMKEI